MHPDCEMAPNVSGVGETRPPLDWYTSAMPRKVLLVQNAPALLLHTPLTENTPPGATVKFWTAPALFRQ